MSQFSGLASNVTFFGFPFGLAAGGFTDFEINWGRGGSPLVEGLGDFAVPGDLLLDLVLLLEEGSSPGSPESPDFLPLLGMVTHNNNPLVKKILIKNFGNFEEMFC